MSQSIVPLEVIAREMGTSDAMRAAWHEFGDEELRHYDLTGFADEVERRLASKIS